MQDDLNIVQPPRRTFSRARTHARTQKKNLLTCVCNQKSSRLTEKKTCQDSDSLRVLFDNVRQLLVQVGEQTLSDDLCRPQFLTQV